MFESLHLGVEPHDENNGLKLPKTQEERQVLGEYTSAVWMVSAQSHVTLGNSQWLVYGQLCAQCKLCTNGIMEDFDDDDSLWSVNMSMLQQHAHGA